jgi:GxxExxY protein
MGQMGLVFEKQKELPVVYKQVRVDCGYRLDFFVEGMVIVELKAVQQLDPIHEAQLLSYLRISKCKVGLLINFNVKLLKNGIRRLVNGL